MISIRKKHYTQFLSGIDSEPLSVLILRHRVIGFQLGICRGRNYTCNAFASLGKKGSGFGTIKGPKINIDWDKRLQFVTWNIIFHCKLSLFSYSWYYELIDETGWWRYKLKVGTIQDRSISQETPKSWRIWGRLSKVNDSLYLLCLLHILHLSSLMIAKQGNQRHSLG